MTHEALLPMMAQWDADKKDRNKKDFCDYPPNPIVEVLNPKDRGLVACEGWRDGVTQLIRKCTMQLKRVVKAHEAEAEAEAQRQRKAAEEKREAEAKAAADRAREEAQEREAAEQQRKADSSLNHTLKNLMLAAIGVLKLLLQSLPT